MGTVAAKQERGGSPFLALMRTSVSLWIVVVMMAMSFGAGVIVKAIAEPTATTTPTTLPTTGQIVAPPLTDDQIAGGLPSGHPDLSDDGSAEQGGQGGGQGGGGQGGGGQGGGGQGGDGGGQGSG